jgi:hypothetical protein
MSRLTAFRDEIAILARSAEQEIDREAAHYARGEFPDIDRLTGRPGCDLPAASCAIFPAIAVTLVRRSGGAKCLR